MEIWKYVKNQKHVKLICNFFTCEAPRSSQELIQKCLCIPGSNSNLEMLVLNERGNHSTWWKTSRSRVENQQQTQPTYDAGSGNQTRDTLVEGEHSHHCTIPALLKSNLSLATSLHRVFLLDWHAFYSKCTSILWWMLITQHMNTLHYQLTQSYWHILI